ncbi:hypothetical protein N7508_009273 [Penicillium antarcticum]|uniref:uncharacterized protein n=1 Tax=Penicillium antarcticum TaxID=416450 RepID=UPI00239B9C16|nr:uncharacterized protein N7508_009273 [Penicillium antarcticum]KAJ5294452.1 hypothetical protein N7508_009273 [Penicillium antarcticum]
MNQPNIKSTMIPLCFQVREAVWAIAIYLGCAQFLADACFARVPRLIGTELFGCFIAFGALRRSFKASSGGMVPQRSGYEID